MHAYPEAKDPSPQTTLVILLGASAWPLSSEFQGSEAFARAARRLKAYFLNPRSFGLPREEKRSNHCNNNSRIDISQF